MKHRQPGAPFGDFVSASRSSIAIIAVVALSGLASVIPCLGMAQDGLDIDVEDPELLVPDIIVRRSDLFDNRIDTGERPGRTLLRFSTGTANIGRGALYLMGETPTLEVQPVTQRIYRRDGSFIDHFAGEYIFHPGHDHTHVEAWAEYRIRELLPDGGVGDVLIRAAKTSFCIIDLQVYSRDIPNFAPIRQFLTCTTEVQGLSVGWIDLYDNTLPDQWIDITGLADGEYWLEAEVDPDNRIIEIDETNNVARILVTIGDPESIPDVYEPNDSLAEVDERLPGTRNSPNLGPCNPKRVIDRLQLPVSGQDYFKFYSNEMGSDDDFVRLDFDSAAGNLDMELLDASGELVATASGDDDIEIISLEGRPEGWYYARVFGREASDSNRYRLLVNPPENEPPAIDVLTPSGLVRQIHGAQSFDVKWSASDAENDLTWVSVFLNDQPLLDGTMIRLATGINIQGDIGLAVVNTAEIPPGRYFVYCQITDGGNSRGVWAQGTLELVAFTEECRTSKESGNDCNDNDIADECEIREDLLADCDGNRIPDGCEIATGKVSDANENGIPDACEPVFHRGDPNDDDSTDISDATLVLGFLFLGDEIGECPESADVDNDGQIAITDAIAALGYLFLGGPPPAAPGPPGGPCGSDPGDATAGFLGCDAYSSCF